ncbi:hypothetical protein NC651_000052 [Populus alba x Populus x berolinensis]|nr:hypothetical protein NC651_000052 [Populus alba x Populus x berolinensis]
MSDGTFSSHICGEVVVVGSPSATVFGRITAESEKHTALAGERSQLASLQLNYCDESTNYLRAPLTGHASRFDGSK